jgi:hypothetical protein
MSKSFFKLYTINGEGEENGEESAYGRIMDSQTYVGQG